MTLLLHTVEALHTANSVASVVLAAGGTTDDVDNEGGENSKAGPLGLAIILLLCIACYFLFRSMSRRLRNVRDNFPTELPGPPGSKSASPPPVRPTGQPAPDFAAEGTAAERAAARSAKERAAADDAVPSITSIPESRPPD
jgi:hypothetical protein